MATPGKRGNSVAEPSSAMSKNRAANYANNRFASFVDSEDQDDNGGGGGVNLRDFDSEGNRISTMSGTPSRSGGGPLRGAENVNPSSTPSSKPTASSRRNTGTIAPIGAGRFTGYSSGDARSATTASMEATIDASINALLNDKANESYGQNEPAAQAGTPYNMRANQNQAGMTMTPNAQYQTYAHHQASAHRMSAHQTGAQINAHHQTNAHRQTNGYPQSASCGMNYGQNQGFNAHGNTPSSSFAGGNMQYPQATPKGYSYGSTYNSTADSYATQQPGGYGAAQGPSGLGTNFAHMNINDTNTPSHVQRKNGNTKYQTATPFAPSFNSFQTEPRNFAPRAGNAPVFLPPPPPFNLGGGAANKQYNSSQATTSGSDPFSAHSSPEQRTTTSINSQALTLSVLPEDNNQTALLMRLHNPEAYGPVPPEIRALRSEQLNRLTDGLIGLPTQDVALNSDNFPFIEACSQAAPVSHGVIKIQNIPFGTKRAEIIAFLGRNSKILNDSQEPVHIIMERVSSKTQDAYVEFVTLHDAMRAVERHQANGQKGRNARLGDRPVEVQLSSQSALMKDLFPLASGVVWDGSKPVIQAPIDGQPWKTFKGFVTEEEMTMLVKHVELPQRSPYSKECPQRPYECMISTIKKLPWYMSNHITVRQRYAVYNATIKLITLLVQALQRETRIHETVINEQLLKRLTTAAMLCPGFSVVQKDNIAVVAHLDDERARMFNQPRFADMWSHLYALCPKPGVPLDVLEWYIAIIREDTTRYIHRKPINERTEIQVTGSRTQLYFGYMWYEMGLPTGKEFDGITLRELARRELAAMERALRRGLPPKM